MNRITVNLVLVAFVFIACEPDSPGSDFPFDTSQDTDVADSSADADGWDTGADTDWDTNYDTNYDVPDYTVDADGGCVGVDFLFVIDNSGSMDDEQSNLISSFHGFMAAITETLELDDYHVMVVDSDAQTSSAMNLIQCNPAGCCVDIPTLCPDNHDAICEDTATGEMQPCTVWLGLEPPTPTCDDTTGAGRTTNGLTDEDCPHLGTNRYFTEPMTLTELDEGFECTGSVGVMGSGWERMMDATNLALNAESATEGCNEGFIREDAILVITLITDEDDGGSTCDYPGTSCSEGDPADWYTNIVAAKGGSSDGIFILGIFGDNDQPGAICDVYDPTSGDGAEPAPRLRELVDSFGAHGQTCSVCLEDYTDCFIDAVSGIDTTCDEYII